MALENRAPILDELEKWEGIEPQDVPLSSLRTHTDLQPRDLALIKNTVARIEQDSRLKGMITDMKTPLRSMATFDVRDPILVAETREGLFVVDGHHRLMAYKAAKRLTIPARVLQVSMGTAIAISRIVNTRGSTVALHKDEVTEGVWATVSTILQYGCLGKERASALGYSINAIRQMFGCQISRDTVRRMLNGVEWLSQERMPRDEWPDWKGYCKLRRDGMIELPEVDESEAVERLAMKLVQVMGNKPDQVARPAINRALELREAGQQALEQNLGVTGSGSFSDDYDPDDPESVY